MANECHAEATGTFGEVLEKELEWLNRQDDSPGEPLSALCLSGGGIRSATYCLGVLQGLADKDQLRRFHYLSTVSGGGYIGSWLTAWIKREGFDKVMKLLARGEDDVEAKPVRRLREYTNYLSPVWGLSTDFLSLVATALRNLTLTWLVLVPLMVAALMLPRLELAVLSVRASPAWSLGCIVAAVALLLLALAYIGADLPEDDVENPPKDLFIPLCFVPVLAATVLIGWVAAWDREWLRGFDLHIYAAAGAALHAVAALIANDWRPRRGLKPRPTSKWDVAIIILSGAFAGAVLFFAFALAGRFNSENAQLLYATLCVPALLGVFWLAGVVYAGATSRIKSEEDREWWARATAWWLGAAVAWIVACVLVFYLPRWIMELPWLQMSHGPQAAGASAALLGVITAAAGFWTKNGAKLREHAKTVLEAIGMSLLDAAATAFIVALLVVLSIAVSCTMRLDSDMNGNVTQRQQSMVALKAAGWELPKKPEPGTFAAREYKEPTAMDAPAAARAHVAYSTVLAQGRWDILIGAILALTAIGLVVLRYTGVNAFSLHGMYANRLARAYLGASSFNRRPHWFTGFDPADNPRMAQDLEVTQLDNAGEGRRLFHIVNSALNIVDSAGDRNEWQQRMATSFTMSRLHCGSRHLGFVPTADYGAITKGLSMARAMAISGAAASPNMGYHTSKPVAFVMTFLNARLGWWMPNPSPDKAGVWGQREPGWGIDALLAEARAATTDKSKFVYLSDGGHFENLGIYEMVQRRCERILVVDASCDADYEFDDLQDAIRKIRIDTGVKIEFIDPLPTPQTVKTTRRHFAVGTIDYSAVDANMKPGSIIYVKPVLAGDEPLDVVSYATRNKEPGRAFPHQPTFDQFFDESQFESYRMLGRHAMRDAFGRDWEEPLVPSQLLSSGKERNVVALPEPVPVPQRPRVSAPEPVTSFLEQTREMVAASTKPAGGMLRGVGEAISGLSQGAMLASAITVTGALAVAGTVALKDGAEVRLSNAQLRVDDESLKNLKIVLNGTAAEDPRTSDLTSLLHQLETRLDEARQALAVNSTATLKLSESAVEQAKATKELVQALPPLVRAQPPTAAFEQVRNELVQLRVDVRALSEADRKRMEEALVNLATAVKNVELAVKGADPRRTIRGVNDGATR